MSTSTDTTAPTEPVTVGARFTVTGTDSATTRRLHGRTVEVTADHGPSCCTPGARAVTVRGMDANGMTWTGGCASVDLSPLARETRATWCRGCGAHVLSVQDEPGSRSYTLMRLPYGDFDTNGERHVCRPPVDLTDLYLADNVPADAT